VWLHAPQDRASGRQTSGGVLLVVVVGGSGLLVEAVRIPCQDVMLVEKARVVVESAERRVDRLALPDQTPEAVAQNGGEAVIVEEGLQRFLARLLGLEAGPFVMPSRRAAFGGGEIGFRLLQPRPGNRGSTSHARGP